MPTISFAFAPMVGNSSDKPNLPCFPKEMIDKLWARMEDKNIAGNIMELHPENFKEVVELEAPNIIKMETAFPFKTKPKFGRNSGRVEVLMANKIRAIAKNVEETQRDSFVKDLDEAIEIISSKYQKDMDTSVPAK